MEEDAKREWRDIRLSTIGSQDYEDIYSGRRRTALENLAHRYKRFAIIGLLFVIWAPLTFYNPEIQIDNRLTIIIFSSIYFLTCGLMDLWLYRGIRSIDCASMTIKEVATRALFYRKRHLQFISILLPFAFIWIGILCYNLCDNTAFLWGVGLGALAGFAIGIRQLMKFLNDYRSITED